MPTHWEADIFFSIDILFKRQCIFYELFSLLSSFLLVLPERFNLHILFFPGFVRAIIFFCPVFVRIPLFYSTILIQLLYIHSSVHSNVFLFLWITLC